MALHVGCAFMHLLHSTMAKYHYLFISPLFSIVAWIPCTMSSKVIFLVRNLANCETHRYRLCLPIYFT